MESNETKKGFDSLVADYEYWVQREPDRGKEWKAALDWALNRAQQYADALGVTRDEVLAAWEQRRDYWLVNYYQESNQPDIVGHNVVTLDEWEKEGEQLYGKVRLDWRFRCPACGYVQTGREFKAAGLDPNLAYQHCASRHDLGGSKTCKWTINGLLRVGGRYVINDHYTPCLIFEFADKGKEE